MALQHQLGKRNPFATVEEHAYLALRRATWKVSSEVATAYASGGLTPSQYNVLRILRGHHPDRLTATDISAQMVSHDADLTRILTELQRRRLVSRRRCSVDRRRIQVGITQDGLALLESLDTPVVKAIRSSLSALNVDALRALIALLEPLCARDRAGDGEH